MSDINKIISNLKSIPPGYGEVPFYWWVGEELTKERLAWQLEKLKGKKISGLQINYAHTDKGGYSYGLSMKSQPSIFSKDWWDLVGWFMEKCKENGFSISLSDYTLGVVGQGFFMDEILRDNKDMQGQNIVFDEFDIKKDEMFCVDYSKDVIAINIIYKDDIVLVEQKLNENTKLIAKDDCKIVIVKRKIVEFSVDPMNKKTGDEVIRTFFQRFEDKFKNEGGKGLNFFFSDELNFGVVGNLWNENFEQEFLNRKGYDIKKYIAGIFVDIGDITPKIRLDYRDVMVSLEEENYFEKVYNWHEERNMTYGCDHGGRGKDILEFGDYFRTQKFNQGPGCDQPFFQSDIIKNKIASSISHLYNRPRTWLEGFHSSGWGTTSAEVLDAVFRNFTSGHNLLSLHGLYYTTNGGFWEWAPPCNHFRMPYWECIDSLLDCSERLSYILSQGAHVCDIGIIYPCAAMEADEKISGLVSVTTAFEIGQKLYENLVDYDFIDFQSIVNAKIKDGKLFISNESYKIIIIPSMKAVRYSMIKKLYDFKKQGGIVIIIGDLPVESDRAGRNDNELNNIIEGLKEHHVKSFDELLSKIKDVIDLDFVYNDNIITNEKIFHMHRKIGGEDLYFIYNGEKNIVCNFKNNKQPLLINPFTGEISSLETYEVCGDRISIKLPLGLKQLNIILFSDNEEIIKNSTKFNYLNGQVKKYALPKIWDCEIIPTLDNCWGDFRKPASNNFIGAEIRKSKFKVNNLYEEGTFGYGDYFYFLEVDKKFDSLELEKKIQKFDFKNLDFENSISSIKINNEEFIIKKYRFSTRYGLENDPGHQGYHGLKGKISNDFIALGKKEEDYTQYNYKYEGKIYYLFTNVFAEKNETAYIISGECKPNKVLINGIQIYSENIELKKGLNPILLKYENECRTHFVISKTQNPFKKEKYPLSMDWFDNNDIYKFTLNDIINECEFKFCTPPGMKKMSFYSYSYPKIYQKDVQLEITQIDENLFGANKYEVNHYFETSENITVIMNNTITRKNTDLLADYIKFDCTKGKIELGDWSKTDGLYSFSGCVKYSTEFDVNADNINKYIELCIDEVSSACKIFINQKLVDVKISPPWNVLISDYIKIGKNIIEIYVYNTLSNHYTTIPTRYRGELVSGIIGDVFINEYND